MAKLRKRTLHKRERIYNINNMSELPEDIMSDAIIFAETPKFWKRKRFNFLLGVSIGLFGMYAASTTPMAQTHLNSLQDYLMYQLADLDFQYMLPPTEFVDELLGNFTNRYLPASTTDAPFMPAEMFREQYDLKPHFPVVMVPGVISSTLESWSTTEKSKKFFRKRLWGSMTMFRSILLDKESWIEHVMLDPETGLDPPGIKLRAVRGVEAADYFVSGYWVWAKVIENLAGIGYDTNNMHFASYDWRLSYSNIERRDKYFSHLKNIIEQSKKDTGLKSVIVAHSMGGSLFPYFLKWVESPLGGNGGSHWTNDHIETFVNIAGSMLGVPKAISTLLSGGNAVWGDANSAPDDKTDEKHDSFGNMISVVSHRKGMEENYTELPDKANDAFIRNYTLNESIRLLEKTAGHRFEAHMKSNYSYGVAASKEQLDVNENDPTKWSNPLESRLPNAPDMKIYCLYGVGIPTERSYYYAAVNDESESYCLANDTIESCKYQPINNLEQVLSKPKTTKNSLSDMFIDTSRNDPVQRVETGVRFSDGDGSVPLLSLGYMCTPSGPWTKHADLYNPGRSPVILKEYQHELDLLHIVSGKSQGIQNRICSQIDEYAKKIKLD
ncbi:LACT-domain-containing protein [Backusella circina FSU 941]|nr:LACT-domain-containing protein [Backusella circina FSU 941]